MRPRSKESAARPIVHGTTSGAAGRVSRFRIQVEPIDPPLYPRRHFITWRTSCQPSRPSRLAPLSSVQPRLPSCCRQQPAAPRRFDTSMSCYLEPNRMMATLGRCVPMDLAVLAPFHPPSKLMVPFDFCGWPLLKDQFRLAAMEPSVRFRLALPQSAIIQDETCQGPVRG
jgi:hypothetical protein